MSHLPLAGKRILVTRSPNQASELAGQLHALGAIPILIPTIEIGPPNSFCALDAVLSSLRAYDLVIFTSANAVRAFQQRAAQLGIMPSPRSIAVVGPATARAIEAIGLTVELIPPTYTAESLAHTLAPTASGLHILLIRPENFSIRRATLSEAPSDDGDVNDSPDPLTSILTAAGATITQVPAYSNRIPAASIAALRDLFADPTHYPDAITFTSASTATNLLSLLTTASLTLPPNILRISIGPITTQAMQSLGIPPHIQAAESSILSLVDALARLVGCHSNSAENDP